MRRAGYTLTILRKEANGKWLLARDANLVTEVNDGRSFRRAPTCGAHAPVANWRTGVFRACVFIGYCRRYPGAAAERLLRDPYVSTSSVVTSGQWKIDRMTDRVRRRADQQRQRDCDGLECRRAFPATRRHAAIVLHHQPGDQFHVPLQKWAANEIRSLAIVFDETPGHENNERAVRGQRQHRDHRRRQGGRRVCTRTGTRQSPLHPYPSFNAGRTPAEFKVDGASAAIAAAYAQLSGQTASDAATCRHVRIEAPAVDALRRAPQRRYSTVADEPVGCGKTNAAGRNQHEPINTNDGRRLADGGGHRGAGGGPGLPDPDHPDHQFVRRRRRLRHHRPHPGAAHAGKARPERDRGKSAGRGRRSRQRAGRQRPEGWLHARRPDRRQIIASVITKNMRYDAVGAFDWIGQIATAGLFIVVRPDSPYKDIKSLVAAAKANPGKIVFGSPGFAATQHLAGELFKQSAGIELLHVPYRTSPEVLAALLSKNVDVVVDTITALLGQVESGQVIALGVTGKDRFPTTPNIPPVIESGVVPGSTSTPVRPLWTQGLATGGDRQAECDAERDADGAYDPRAAGKIGAVVKGSTPAEFAQLMAAEHAKWSKVREAAGIEQK